MARRNTKFTNRAWRLLRVAILWARKGGMFKQNRILLQLRLLKGLKLKHSRQTDHLYRGQNEFSFDETPAFKFKTPSLRFLPCITPEVDNDYDQDEVDFVFCRDKSCDNLIEFEYEEYEYDQCDDREEEIVERGENEIDEKAEQFISKFYEEIKLQRQRSAIRYYEMLERSV